MNCKPGDLAYVVCGEQAGAVVEVKAAEIPFDDGSPAWRATSTTPLMTIKRRSRQMSEGTQFRVRDSWLRPISGIPVYEEQRDEVLE